MQNVNNGGLMSVPQIAAQTVYLDFDGEITSYNGELLTVENVIVEDSKLTQMQITEIVNALNTQYFDRNVVFTADKPADGEYSTVYVGKTSSFDAYGNFVGLAETNDIGNQNKADNAFVMLDNTASTTSIISTISHEVEHLLGTGTHGGDGLSAYAYEKYVLAGESSSYVSVGYGDRLWVYGSVDYTSIISGGEMSVSSGGTADHTNLNVAGLMYVVGGYANSTSIAGQAQLHVSRGGLASNTYVNYGEMHIGSGGTGKDVIVNNLSGGILYVHSRGYAQDITVSRGTVLVDSGSATNISLNDRGALLVSTESSFVSNVVVNDGGDVGLDGSATGITINSGGCARFYGKVANAELNGGGLLYINGGTNTNINVNAGGVMRVSAGMSDDTNVNNGGCVHVFKGVVLNTDINAGGVVSNYGGDVLSPSVSAGGLLYNFGSGAVIDSLDVKPGGTVIVGSESKLTGLWFVSQGANVYIENDAIIDFDVSAYSPDFYVPLSDYTLLQNANNAHFTISVYEPTEKDVKPNYGTYKLANNAYSFSTYATVVNVATDKETELGVITVDNPLTTSKAKYVLSMEDGTLTFTIQQQATNVRQNLLENGYSQIVAFDATNHNVGYLSVDGLATPPWNGVWSWGEKDNWKVVAVGRFAGSNVKHDGLLLYNTATQSYASWSNLDNGDYGYHSLCYVEDRYSVVSIMNADDSEYDDVLLFDKQSGSFAILTEGVNFHDVWHSDPLDDPATDLYEVKGAGDFTLKDKDGKPVGDTKTTTDQILVKRKEDNAYFLWTNNDTKFQTWDWTQKYIGSLGNEWEVAGIGDFSADETDDIAMWNKNTGVVMIWENGQSSKQRYAGTLDPNSWEIAGVGDYNGDGKEDLLLRELSTGWGGIGYWADANCTKWTDLNVRIESNNATGKYGIIA